jgi:catechol 2,3-dioxygenase-like lactoylglutathione lyase family enzyme
MTRDVQALEPATLTIQRMDHVGVVGDDLEAAVSFVVELGMELDGGTTPVEGDWVDRVVGLDEVRVDLPTPLGRSRGCDGRASPERTEGQVPSAAH